LVESTCTSVDNVYVFGIDVVRCDGQWHRNTKCVM